MMAFSGPADSNGCSYPGRAAAAAVGRTAGGGAAAGAAAAWRLVAATPPRILASGSIKVLSRGCAGARAAACGASSAAGAEGWRIETEAVGTQSVARTARRPAPAEAGPPLHSAPVCCTRHAAVAPSAPRAVAADVGLAGPCLGGEGGEGGELKRATG